MESSEIINDSLKLLFGAIFGFGMGVIALNPNSVSTQDLNKDGVEDIVINYPLEKRIFMGTGYDSFIPLEQFEEDKLYFIKEYSKYKRDSLNTYFDSIKARAR